ncbi:hypothetical protein P20652_0410 [Pseudoalteromonas sp. BSi20652]|nr:hypothetical protein P20652_0410 [Pseudoalteromonas sp. BSi20652]
MVPIKLRKRLKLLQVVNNHLDKCSQLHLFAFFKGQYYSE